MMEIMFIKRGGGRFRRLVEYFISNLHFVFRITSLTTSNMMVMLIML